MGFPYHEVIPPAILLDNPRIDRRTFAQLLNRTKATWIFEYGRTDPWDSGTKCISEYHSGLEGLARVLGLKETEQYKRFRTPSYDSNRLIIHPPQLTLIREESGIFPDFKFEVAIHEEIHLENQRERKTVLGQN